MEISYVPSHLYHMVFELFKVDMVLYFRFTWIEEMIIDCKYIIFYVSPSLECNEGYC